MITSSPSHKELDLRAVPVPPIDTNRLDALLEEAGLDTVLDTSKHNIHHLQGGYFSCSHMDPHGLSRYLPFLVYVKVRPHETSYVASPMEAHEHDTSRFWLSKICFGNMT